MSPFTSPIGFSFVFGMEGKKCRAANYAGWFKEFGASVGCIGGSCDIGTDEQGESTGVWEAGPCCGVGAKVKAAWCYYWVVNEVIQPSGSCKCRENCNDFSISFNYSTGTDSR
jgi:hypothetical protein